MDYYEYIEYPHMGPDGHIFHDMIIKKLVKKRVLLNGFMVDPKEVNPAKHKYIGKFRPTIFPEYDIYLACTCGYFFTNGFNEHQEKGCFDIPQYMDI